MRPIQRSDKFDTAGNPVEYNPWSDAKKTLIDEIGDYCSYCGKHLTRSALAIEHIHAKKCTNTAGVFIYESQQYHWNNFLLSCTNCNSVKANKDVVILQPYLPHLDNLLCGIEITQSGLIQLKTNLPLIVQQKTQAFIDLIGLNRDPSHPKYSDKDDRWEYRMTAYEEAENQLKNYQQGTATITQIVTIARKFGFFTVWYLRFANYTIVRAALINAFVGTRIAAFDASNNYNPI
mgnify:CR=1 FL=1